MFNLGIDLDRFVFGWQNNWNISNNYIEIKFSKFLRLYPYIKNIYLKLKKYHFTFRPSVNPYLDFITDQEANYLINEIIDQFPGVDFNLQVCGGNAHRKRGFFGKYTDMISAFKKLKINEIHLEHCSLHYNMLDVFNEWSFDGKISLGVIDQRIDNIESTEDIIKAIKPALKYFTKDRILLTSECGFGHVPIDIVRSKIKKIAEVGNIIRE